MGALEMIQSGTASRDTDTLLVLDAKQSFPQELVGALRRRFKVTVRSGMTGAFADLALNGGAVLLAVRRDTVNGALNLVHDLRRAGSTAPIILVTQFTLRADDRDHALAAGADEFLSGELHPNDFLSRVERVVDRGHLGETTNPEIEVPFVTQPSADGFGYKAMDAHAFRNAVNAHMAGDRVPFFALVTLSPSQAGSAQDLTRLVLRRVRIDGGDLAGVVDDSVAVYLHSTRRKDVTSFVDWMREQWQRAGNGDLHVSVAAYPAEENHVLTLLQSPAATI
jgi:DNA-binding response OmpR family regulator